MHPVQTPLSGPGPRACASAATPATERTHWPQWFLLAGLRGRDAWCAPDPAGLTPLYPPADRFWADPFAWSEAGRRFIFLEEYPFHTGRGRISVLELGPDLTPLGPAVPVIDEDRHLSYPFLFSFEGDLYMVPESAASRRVDLYRCHGFPYGWTRVGTLIAGIQAADATLFEHQGRWWLLCSARQGRARLNDSLFAFHADSPLATAGPPMPATPWCGTMPAARPGGRVFVDDQGRLLRPAQVSVPRYGYGLALNEVLELTPERFRERPHLAGHRGGERRLARHAPSGLAPGPDGHGRPAPDPAPSRPRPLRVARRRGQPSTLCLRCIRHAAAGSGRTPDRPGRQR